jgi:predicted metalloprotease with PDZ domain
MRGLWQRSGGGPISEADIVQVLGAVAGRSLVRELNDWVHGTDELPVAELLQSFGVELRPERAGFAAGLGLRLSEQAVSGVQVQAVLADSAAAAAGLAAGDELLAVDGWRIRRLDEALAWVARDQPFDLLLVRDQRVMTLRVKPDALSALADTVSLHLHDKPGRAVAERRRAWFES